MEEKIQSLTRMMNELVIEIGDLMEKVARLENRIELLENASAKEEPEPEPSAPEISAVGTDEEKLERLYNLGYHICHGSFGHPRSEECIFCTSLLQKS